MKSTLGAGDKQTWRCDRLETKGETENNMEQDYTWIITTRVGTHTATKKEHRENDRHLETEI